MAKARVLAVDDQRYFRELIGSLLREEGYEVETASSGEEALRILERADYDVVLTDLVMPGMDGSELVRRVKLRSPEQDVVVVTGVVDIATAVEAMKLGASDYLLKPFDRRTLAVTLEGLLQRRAVRTERDRLLAENIEYIAETRLLESALGFYAAPALEPLAARTLRAMCLETGAQGGVLWAASESRSGALDLAAAHGLVRLSDEPASVDPGELPAVLLAPGASAVLAEWGDDRPRAALYVALRRGAALVGLVRLTDKLEGESFDELDRVAAEKLGRHAQGALAHALRVRALERRSFEDPETGVWRYEFLVDVARSELEKAHRFGRRLSLLAIDPGWPDDRPPPEGRAAFARALAGPLRGTDLLAIDARGRFHVLLAECDALGAAVFKRRCRAALERSEAVARLAAQARPTPRIASACYPGDATQLDGLSHCLEHRLELGRQSLLVRLGLERLPLDDALRALLREGVGARAETAAQVVRFALAEIARRPRERRLVYVAPGEALAGPVRQALEPLRGLRSRSEVVVLGGDRPPADAPSVAWVAPERVPELAPCLVHYGDGAAYVLVRAPGEADASPRLFHSADRELVEYLAFRLQQEVAVPPTLEEAA